MRSYLNDINNPTSIINSLPVELKNLIIDTNTRSENESYYSADYYSIDKLYLLDPVELFPNYASYYRQLDYYQYNNVSSSSCQAVFKKNSNGLVTDCWMRSPSNNYSGCFIYISSSCSQTASDATNIKGVSPAFRIAE
jgi:hypothetical protein